MRVALLGFLLTLAAQSAAAGKSSPSQFALQPSFLSKPRGGAAAKTLPKPEDEASIRKIGAPLSQQASLTEKEAPLVEDIELLSDILAETVKRVNPKIHDIYTKFRKLGLAR